MKPEYMLLFLQGEGKKKEVRYVLSTPWRHMRDWRYSSTHSNVDTRRRCVVRFTPPPRYHIQKSPWYPLNRRQLWNSLPE